MKDFRSSSGGEKAVKARYDVVAPHLHRCSGEPAPANSCRRWVERTYKLAAASRLLRRNRSRYECSVDSSRPTWLACPFGTVSALGEHGRGEKMPIRPRVADRTTEGPASA